MEFDEIEVSARLLYINVLLSTSIVDVEVVWINATDIEAIGIEVCCRNTVNTIFPDTQLDVRVGGIVPCIAIIESSCSLLCCEVAG